MTIKSLFKRYEDRKWLLVAPGGNQGDQMIYTGARKLADQAELDYKEITLGRNRVNIPDIEETTKGGIIKASQTMKVEEVGSICGFVITMGEDCYQDEKRFPNGPYCKEGDWIIMRSYSGTRFKVHGKEFRLINDDSVEAVVEDPRGIVKVV